uniref:C2H2-type domain-containing protein n=1 Tax=Trichogramma kaykai TaxID=54128 RepID=A0ABD2WR55_9HYME
MRCGCSRDGFVKNAFDRILNSFSKIFTSRSNFDVSYQIVEEFLYHCPNEVIIPSSVAYSWYGDVQNYICIDELFFRVKEEPNKVWPVAGLDYNFYSMDSCKTKNFATFMFCKSLICSSTKKMSTKGRKDYGCNKCDKKFARKSNMILHQKVVHEGRKDNCKKKFRMYGRQQRICSCCKVQPFVVGMKYTPSASYTSVARRVGRAVLAEVVAVAVAEVAAAVVVVVAGLTQAVATSLAGHSEASPENKWKSLSCRILRGDRVAYCSQGPTLSLENNFFVRKKKLRKKQPVASALKCEGGGYCHPTWAVKYVIKNSETYWATSFVALPTSRDAGAAWAAKRSAEQDGRRGLKDPTLLTSDTSVTDSKRDKEHDKDHERVYRTMKALEEENAVLRGHANDLTSTVNSLTQNQRHPQLLTEVKFINIHSSNE